MGVLDGYSVSNFDIDGFQPCIKKIQHGTAIIAGDEYSFTAIISPVDKNKSIVLVTWEGLNSTVGDMPTAQITANNQITFGRGYNGSNATNICWQVIEFRNIKSLQTGQAYTATEAYININISPVQIDKAMLIGTIRRASTDALIRYGAFRTKFTSDSQIRFEFYDIRRDTYVVWQVVEFS